MDPHCLWSAESGSGSGSRRENDHKNYKKRVFCFEILDVIWFRKITNKFCLIFLVWPKLVNHHAILGKKPHATVPLNFLMELLALFLCTVLWYSLSKVKKSSRQTNTPSHTHHHTQVHNPTQVFTPPLPRAIWHIKGVWKCFFSSHQTRNFKMMSES